MSKKIVSLVLAVAMLLSLLAFQAFGAEAEDVINATLGKDNSITEKSDVKHIFTKDEIDHMHLGEEEEKHFRDGLAKMGTIQMGNNVPVIVAYIQVEEPTVFHITMPNTTNVLVHMFAEDKWEDGDYLFDAKNHVLSFYVEDSMAVVISVPAAQADEPAAEETTVPPVQAPAPSPVAVQQAPDRTAALPEVVARTEAGNKRQPIDFKHVDADGKHLDAVDGNTLIALHDADKLTAEQQAALKNALEALPGAVSDDFSVRYFFYSKTAETYNMKIALENAEEAKALKFVDGDWAEMETKLDTTAKTLTVMDMVDAPVAILAK